VISKTSCVCWWSEKNNRLSQCQEDIGEMQADPHQSAPMPAEFAE